jgi:hypothetical protein
MKITIQIERTEDSDPSFLIPEDSTPLEEEFDVDEATISMSQDSRLLSDRPVVEINVIDRSDDIKSKLAFLEWANCYWNEKQPQGSRLRQITLKFYDDDTKKNCYRSFVIPSAFLADFTEEVSAKSGITEISYKAKIRSNDKKQDITFLPGQLTTA